MTTSLITDYLASQTTGRSGPPVGRAFTAFTAVIVTLLALAAVESTGRIDFPTGSSSQFGVVAATTFAIAGTLAAYRAFVIRNLWAAAIAAVLLGSGATWSWSTFVAEVEDPRFTTSMVISSAGVLAIVLLANGLRLAHWLEVFGGLGSCGLMIVAILVRFDPEASSSLLPALMAAVAGMVCLYGLLVDVEVSEHRSLIELVESRKRIEQEVSQVEELLHDLRSGLLAIEAAIGSFDGELAMPLRAEAARLRRLTLNDSRTVANFDLVDRVESLVATHQAAGVQVGLRSPEHAAAWGEESEVLAIVDNLLSNAERHGDEGPIMIEIANGDGSTRLSVSNSGELPVGEPDELFLRGVTTHPDGQGLGLARAKMLAEVNGADLRLGPAKDGQVTFVLSLKAQSPAAVA